MANAFLQPLLQSAKMMLIFYNSVPFSNFFSTLSEPTIVLGICLQDARRWLMVSSTTLFVEAWQLYCKQQFRILSQHANHIIGLNTCSTYEF